MSTTENRASFSRLYDVINTGDRDLLDTYIDEIADPDLLMHTPLPRDASGADGLKYGLAALRRAFPDLHLRVEDVIAEGDKVVARVRVTGTHHGDHMGIAPTGRSFEIDEIAIARFEAGRMVEVWGVVDVFSQMQQLGALGPADPVAAG